MAASEAAKAHTAETSDRKQEEATASADSAEPGGLNDLLSGRQSCGIPSALEDVIRARVWCEKGAANETCYQMAVRKDSQSVALQKELQTKSCHSNPTGTEGRTVCASCPGRSSDQYI